MMKIHIALLAFSVALLACAETPEESALRQLLDAKGSLRILCSHKLQAIPEKLVQHIGADNAELKISVEAMPTSDIENELRNGKASLAIVDSPLSAANISLKSLAASGLLFAVNAQFGPAKLTKAQIDNALSGKISDWSELGMPKGPLRFYCPNDKLPADFEPSEKPEKEDSKEHETPQDNTKGHKKSHASNKNPFLRIMLPVADEAKALSFVAEDPCGLTTIKLGSRSLAPKGVRFIAIDGVQPGSEPASLDSYPFARTIYLACPAGKDELGNAFATLLLSKDFAGELSAQGFLPFAKEEGKTK